MENANDKRLFWACFLALIATAFGFIVRGALLDQWAEDFGMNSVEKGQIGGVGIWPFAVSIILFSLIIDKIGYGKAMVFAFIAHVTYAIVVICAPMVLAGKGASPDEVTAGQTAGYWVLYIGNLIFALGNGAVEAVINPIVATMFNKDKTKWLNILHAGWPGGLVLAGLIMISMGGSPWQYKVALIFIPVIGYGLMMMGCKFPVNERVAAGGTYREMLQEFGILGALIAVTLIVREVGGSVFEVSWQIQLGIIVVTVGAFGAYVRSLGRPMFIFLMLIMIPLATTELGTDNWITSLMEPQMTALGVNALWVLVYTSFIMMILRFFAGPIVHKFSPLGLLMLSSIIAALGLVFLSKAAGVYILGAATLYGFGKTFFWPTMLGVVSEQFPKGGALALNATGGIGMLGVGVLGAPFIGLLQENAVHKDLDQAAPGIYEIISEDKVGALGKYKVVSPDKKKNLSKEDFEKVDEIEQQAKQGALATMAVFPIIMLVCYTGLFFYFKSRGGYKAEELVGHTAEDGKYTGGVEGPVE